MFSVKQQLWFRGLSLFLVLVLILQLFPTGILAAENADEGNWISEPPVTAAASVVGEVPEYRALQEKHFRMSDGSFIAVDYGVPVHYALDEETWADIDNTLVLQSMGAATASAAMSRPMESPQQYTAVNGDDAKTFAANLSTGFLFSAQRGQVGVQMSLMDGMTEPTELVSEETVPEETAAEETIASATEPEVPAQTDPVEMLPQTEQVTEPIVEMTEATLPEETAATADMTASSTLPVAASESHGETLPTEPQETVLETIPETTPETEAETVPETEPETLPETEPETIPETEAETLPVEEAQPVEEEILEPYNRSATAQISYPDRKEEAPIGVATLFAAVRNLLQEDEETSFAQQIMPSRLRTLVLYENVFPGVDLQYELYSYDVKESILVKEPLSGYSFSFRLDLAGLTPAMQEDESILLTDSGENVIYAIPAPYMTDADGAYSEAVTYQLTRQEDGTWILTVTADESWIESPDRAFPVCIDPTLVYETTSRNFVGTVCTESNDSVSATTNLACGYHPDHGKMEIYYKLTDLPEVPTGHTLVRAQAGFLQNDFRSGSNSTSGSMVLYMSEITQSATLNSSLTWANRPSHGPTLDYVDASNSTIGKIRLWDITPAAKNWYENGTNYGLVMTSNSDSNSKNRAWFSYYSKVIFVASYRSTNGIEGYYTYQTMGVGNAGTAYIGDFSGQLTVCKNLVSYASTVNPVSVDLVYNSSYAMQFGEENYDASGWMGLGMHVGAGVNLSVMQRVQKVELQNDTNANNKSTYLKYTDGDGTIHYFAEDSSKTDGYYYDEDGMGLKINEYRTGCYVISDDKDNEMYFVNGYLTLINDANGNEIQIHYIHSDGTSSSNGHPNASGDRISKIVQKNNGGSAITVATFAYSSDNWLTSITDAAGNVYKFTYSNGRLFQITRGSTVLAQYGTNSTRMSYAYDAEAKQGIHFEYTKGQVSKYWEYTGSGETGITMEISHPENGQTIYRSYGIDQIKNDNDILTHYTFDYAGRSVNAYTTDLSGNILGASNMVYTGTGTTDMTNNRTLRTASIGVSAMNELRNHGFELDSPAWSFTGAGGANTNILAKAENPRTGSKALKGWIKAGQTSTISATRTTDTLEANTAYTLSAYVNTAQCTSFSGDGVYLQVKSGNTVLATSEKLNYRTSSAVDDGWVRLSVTFVPKTRGTYTIGVYNHGASPYFFADDLQLEKGETPSNVNLLENGNLQYWGHAWKNGNTSNPAQADFYVGVGLFTTSSSAHSIRLVGDAYANKRASQTVPINEAGGSYVFSGWAKANAVPDNLDTNKDDPAQDDWKEFGLRAIVTYANNDTEYHYVPFNSDVTDWQFTSLTIVPKQREATVSTIQVLCVYDKNGNQAFFDNLSLVKEAAQTMTYDENGNLKSVLSSGSEGENATYDENGNLKSVTTGGNGTFTYTYDDKNRVKTVSNGVVKESYTRDGYGNVTNSTLTSNSGSGGTMTSSTSYTNSGNLVISQTDTRGNTVTSSYYNASTNSHKMNYMLGAPYCVTDANGTEQYYIHDQDTGRQTMTYIHSVVCINNNYNDRGMLGSITRAGYYDNNGVNTRATQDYIMTYDQFGNTTKIEVGTEAGTLALGSYTYAPRNGVLQRMTYGNGDYTDYAYDNLGRTTKVTTSDGEAYDYTYTGNGQLFSVNDLTGGLKYRYHYDDLGRLIGSSINQDNETLLRIQAQYDENSRISGQSWQMGEETYSEGFVYDDHGRLTSKTVTQAGTETTVTNTYDALSRLSTRTGPVSKATYSYLAGANGTTTGLVSSVTHSKVGTNSFSPITFGYTYDKLGYITTYSQTGRIDTTYEYDQQGQLIQAIDNGECYNYSYTYDTVGNIRSLDAYCWGDSDYSYTNTYTYGNPKWLDLLTGFNDEPILYEGQSLVDGEILGDPVSGNPISYFNGTRWSFDWENGRQLATAESTDSTGTVDTLLSYEYDINGLRTSKTVTTNTYTLQEHAHNFTKTVVKEPTCTEAGSNFYTCSCGYSYEEHVAALGHVLVLVQNVYRCKRCGYEQKPIVIDPIRPVDPPVDIMSVEQEDATAMSAEQEEVTTLRVLASTVTEHHDYVYAGGKLLREVITRTDADGNVTTEVLDFTYDASGNPYALTYTNGTATPVTYYYVVNPQGDVIRLVSTNGATVAQYWYGPYGEVRQAYGDMAEVNPLRYRSYYYDGETGLYYVSSRYYDPEIGRWINADGYVSTGQGILGNNMFAYCGNNPVNRVDPTGQFWSEIWEFAKTAVTEIGKAMGVMSPAYTGCGGAAVADGPLPFGDIVAAAGAALLTVGAIGYGIYQATQAPAISVPKVEEKSEAIVIPKEPDSPVIFPVDPNTFNPVGLVKVPRAGTKNGAFISWMDPLTNTEVFRWDENPNYSNGPHYHIHGTGHYYPGMIVPEPYATIYFPFR